MEQLYTYKTAAAILDCSAAKVKKMVLNGELACIKLGNETRIRQSTLLAWMDAGEHFHVKKTVGKTVGTPCADIGSQPEKALR